MEEQHLTSGFSLHVFSLYCCLCSHLSVLYTLPFFLLSSSCPLLVVRGRGAHRKLNPTHHHSATIPGPHYQDSGTITLKNMMCRIKGFLSHTEMSALCLPYVSFSVFPLSSSHTSVSAKCKKSSVKPHAGPHGSIEWHVCDPASQRNPAQCKQAHLHKLL